MTNRKWLETLPVTKAASEISRMSVKTVPEIVKWLRSECRIAEYANEESKPKYDNINHPEHYTHTGIECIDVMVAIFGKPMVMGFCICNAFKYVWRHGKKNGAEDIRKAVWYLEKWVELDGDGSEEA